MGYINRQDAGKRLAEALGRFKGKSVVVLALPRGGVALGVEVARALGAPLGLMLVRKIGHPSYHEYAIGAVAEGEKPTYNESEVALIDKKWLEEAERSALEVLEHRRRLYYGGSFKPPEIMGKTVVIVDDGIATGLTMEAAVRAVQNKHPKRVVVAVPVASQDSVDTLENIADEVVVLDDPESFSGAVGSHYQQFDQVDDEEVQALLREFNDHVLSTTTKHESAEVAS